uniref:Secreted protein n=1 Tax=Callorhinchus milii TaxID=7868 RepID=A0A4W3KJR3_CALMI
MLLQFAHLKILLFAAPSVTLLLLPSSPPDPDTLIRSKFLTIQCLGISSGRETHYTNVICCCFRFKPTIRTQAHGPS